jgi:hypothetical protein
MGAPSSWDIRGLERLRQTRYRVAVYEEKEQQHRVERKVEVGAGLGDKRAARQRHRVLDADNRDQRRGHRQDRVEVHPWGDHALDRLRQDDAPERLDPREGEAFSRLPLADRDRLDPAAHDLSDVRHDRQGEPDDRLEPGRQRNGHAREFQLERQQEHREEQQHKPR